MSQENVTNKQPLIRPVNRQQMCWRAVDVERLIGEDHRARAIWALVGRLDLQRFYEDIESSAEQGGRPAFDPQLLISLWVYAYSEGIGSAREVARRCEFDPAFQWLTGLEEVNYHTLASFRVEKQQELDELFTQVFGAITAKQRFENTWSGRGSGWPRWAIRRTKRAVQKPGKPALERGRSNKNGWRTRCRNWRSCRRERRERKPRAGCA